jgi:RNA polymerase sigma factor (sigma-70 family)
MKKPQDQSVTHWIAALRGGDEEAARALWQRYFAKLVHLARQKLGSAPRRVADEEDVALSVFRRLCDGAEQGRFKQLSNRDDLWRLLVAITINRAIDQRRHDRQRKRGGGKVRGESYFRGGGDSVGAAGLDEFIAPEPTPEMLHQITEEHEHLMGKLNVTLRQIAVWKLESLNNEEIAANMGITSRSVRRKLEQIREIWQEEIEA